MRVPKRDPTLENDPCAKHGQAQFSSLARPGSQEVVLEKSLLSQELPGFRVSERNTLSYALAFAESLCTLNGKP